MSLVQVEEEKKTERTDESYSVTMTICQAQHIKKTRFSSYSQFFFRPSSFSRVCICV